MSDPFNPMLPPHIVKIKADNEKLPEKAKPEDEKFVKEIEKVKADNEKLPVKEKHEKIEKREFKENKLEFKENKNEIKEIKGDKEKDKEKEKEFKENKLEIKEIKIEKIEQREDVKLIERKVVKEVKEGEVPGFEELRVSPQIDRDMLLRHAEALEAMGRELRHFIEAGDRPDLSRGALHEEPDQQDEHRDDNQ